MKLTFSAKPIESVANGYARVRLTEEPKTVRRIVREQGIEWIEVGTGKASTMNRRRFIILCRAIVQAAKQHSVRKIALQFDKTPEMFNALLDATPEDLSSLAAQNFEMADFEFTAHKTKPAEGWNQLEEILLCGKSSTSVEAAAKRGQMIGQAVNDARALSGAPGGHMTPRTLAGGAKKAVQSLPVTVTTLGRTQIEKLGMGLLAGVGAGSTNEPTFTVMEYRGGAKTAKPIVIAGKGITFDTGGLNLKPSASIYEMHMDMSGAAAVISTVALAARLKLKKNVIGLIPAAENMVGANATRPGDIHTSLSGKTVEVTDTDAEGRLVLADAITYAKRFNPSVVIDTATLTGASMVALGLYTSGLLTRDDALANQLLTLSEETGDYVWRLPLWEEYESLVQSPFADLQNHPIGNKYGGATVGATFLWEFAKELSCPWAHLDIAPRMTAAPGDELAKGAAGASVRLLIAFIESWKS